ncbi:MAG: hypothetical protein H6835_13230 [Planctomycetes bacterium]|nr:hypothetical protein [Planctomycetota bacterium]
MPSPRLLFLAVAALLGSDLLAHGGQYRGPGEVTPQQPVATNSTTTTRNGPSSPVGGSNGAAGVSGAAPAGGVGNPTGSVVAAAPTAQPTGVGIGEDLGRWEFWWEFGKDPYLQLRDTLYQGRRVDPERALLDPRVAAGARDLQRPSPADLRRVASALSATLSAAGDRDTVSSCLVALAKIGPQRAGFDLRPQLTPLLQRGDQELRETAALAIGIAGEADDATVQLLRSLIEDDADGRRVSGDHPVNERTQAFAAYGAGLLLRRTRDAATALRLIDPLVKVVRDADERGRNLAVAAIEALSSLATDWQGRAAEVLRERIVETLGNYYSRELGAGDELVQAHVPPAIARLLGPTGRLAPPWRERFVADLRASLHQGDGRSSSKVNAHTAQSCAMALGDICSPWDDDESDCQAVGELLLEVYRHHGDQQTRAFAAMSLARIGGDAARAALLREIDTANKAIEQPWLACALGVMVARQRTDDSPVDAPPEVVEALLRGYREAKNPSTVAALAIALAMAGVQDAADALRMRLVEDAHKEQVAGYLALALGMLQDRRALPELRTLRAEARHRPFLLLQSVRALGMLGDHELAAQLQLELARPNQSLVQLAATSSALGQIGDRRSLEPLLRLLDDKTLPPLSRAFVAVALGNICDKDPLPWNATYASTVNYRASTETLTDGQSGVLDIL